jgi:hypothetical protein
MLDTLIVTYLVNKFAMYLGTINWNNIKMCIQIFLSLQYTLLSKRKVFHVLK